MQCMYYFQFIAANISVCSALHMLKLSFGELARGEESKVLLLFVVVVVVGIS